MQRQAGHTFFNDRMKSRLYIFLLILQILAIQLILLILLIVLLLGIYLTSYAPVSEAATIPTR